MKEMPLRCKNKTMKRLIKRMKKNKEKLKGQNELINKHTEELTLIRKILSKTIMKPKLSNSKEEALRQKEVPKETKGLEILCILFLLSYFDKY